MFTGKFYWIVCIFASLIRIQSYMRGVLRQWGNTRLLYLDSAMADNIICFYGLPDFFQYFLSPFYQQPPESTNGWGSVHLRAGTIVPERILYIR